MTDVLDVLRASGRYSQAKRNHQADDPAVVAAHRDLIAARIIVHVNEIMAGAPPLAAAQIERIAALLRDGGVR